MQELIKKLLRVMAVYFFSTNIVLFVDKTVTGMLMRGRNTNEVYSSNFESFLILSTIIILTLILFVLAEQLSKLIVGNTPADEMLIPDLINIQILARLGIFLIGLKILVEGLIGMSVSAFHLSQGQMLFTSQVYNSIAITFSQPLIKLILGGALIVCAKSMSVLFKDSEQH